jgi:hypothetical protein
MVEQDTLTIVCMHNDRLDEIFMIDPLIGSFNIDANVRAEVTPYYDIDGSFIDQKSIGGNTLSFDVAMEDVEYENFISLRDYNEYPYVLITSMLDRTSDGGYKLTKWRNNKRDSVMNVVSLEFQEVKDVLVPHTYPEPIVPDIDVIPPAEPDFVERISYDIISPEEPDFVERISYDRIIQSIIQKTSINTIANYERRILEKGSLNPTKIEQVFDLFRVDEENKDGDIEFLTKYLEKNNNTSIKDMGNNMWQHLMFLLRKKGFGINIQKSLTLNDEWLEEYKQALHNQWSYGYDTKVYKEVLFNNNILNMLRKGLV